ncbi:hypothetical protein BC941DRAFT_432441, partial [Chlamydoabsidia padenii]
MPLPILSFFLFFWLLDIGLPMEVHTRLGPCFFFFSAIPFTNYTNLWSCNQKKKYVLSSLAICFSKNQLKYISVWAETRIQDKFDKF